VRDPPDCTYTGLGRDQDAVVQIWAILRQWIAEMRIYLGLPRGCSWSGVAAVVGAPDAGVPRTAVSVPHSQDDLDNPSGQSEQTD
jgi:hypothetical protein